MQIFEQEAKKQMRNLDIFPIWIIFMQIFSLRGLTDKKKSSIRSALSETNAEKEKT